MKELLDNHLSTGKYRLMGNSMRAHARFVLPRLFEDIRSFATPSEDKEILKKCPDISLGMKKFLKL